MQLLGWSCRSNGCIQVIIPNGELRSYELNFPITGAMNWICTELLVCRKLCLWCANVCALATRRNAKRRGPILQSWHWGNPGDSARQAVRDACGGETSLGQRIIVPPRPGQWVSGPLESSTLENLEKSPKNDDKWRFIAGKHIYKWI